MDKSVAERVYTWMNEESDAVSLIENYSGRGMFGEKTAAVRVPGIGAFYEAALSIIADELQYGDLSSEDLVDELVDLIDVVKKVRWDNFGLDMVIY